MNVDCVAMDRESIVQALKSSCGNKNLKFQVIIQNSKLHIYINHKTEFRPDSEFLVDCVTNAIAPLDLDEFKGVWLYSRQLGEIEPNWQSFLELPLKLDTDILDTVGIAEHQEVTEITKYTRHHSSSDTDLLDAVEMVHQEALQEEESNTFAQDLVDESELTESLYPEFDAADFDGQDSSGDTDLLRAEGMIHKEALHEEEINTFASRLTEDSIDLVIPKIRGDLASAAANQSDDALAIPEKLDLTQYCFVINKKILTADILPPDKDIIRLVKFFHHLSDGNKQKILPILDNYFKLAKIPDINTLAVALQKWFKQITELDEEKRRTAEIWLSRYCFARDATMEELKTAAVKTAAMAAEAKQKRDRTEYAFTPANHENHSQAQSQNELIDNKFNLPPFIQRHILPLAWTLGTIILIALGILTANSTVSSQTNPQLCLTSLATPQYCRLGVNLAGERAIKAPNSNGLLLTEITMAEATRGCERYANVKAGMTNNFDPRKTPVISSYGEKILPQIYVVEAKQKSVKDSGTVRVGCVYTTGKGERSPALIKADIIPQNWPQEPYQSQIESQSNISFGIFTHAINLGVYTIFTAIGIAIASKLNIGIEVARSQTIYLVALVVAMVQIVAGINFWAGTILPILVMVALSAIVKDFRLNKNFGYPLVAGGIFIIIATQFLLYGLFQLIINGLI